MSEEQRAHIGDSMRKVSLRWDGMRKKGFINNLALRVAQGTGAGEGEALLST